MIAYILSFQTGASSKKLTIASFLPLCLSRRILNAFVSVETEMPLDPSRIGFIDFGEEVYHFSKGFKEDCIREIFAYDKNAMVIR